MEIKNLTKRFGKTIAVNDISLEIEKGDFFGFLGPNGAGKTTTINCVAGIAVPTEGQIKVFGKDVVRNYREARGLVGLSPQEINVDVFASARRTLYYSAGYFGIKTRERPILITEVLERVGLRDFADKPFLQLSGGLKKRVMLARAMIHNPELLILDEPTAGMDVETKHEFWQYLRDLNKSGKTILLTSHYLEEVELLCNKIAIINRGRIAAIGDKEDFIRDGKSLEETYLKITNKSI